MLWKHGKTSSILREEWTPSLPKSQRETISLLKAFAEQLTKETQDLKVKIENHKRENRRLTSLIDQQRDDGARLTVRLSGTEKQRDDALEALVLQQEIAEELERERIGNKKDLTSLQHTNTTLLRQRDDAQRVVLHLRALIDGQSHHMEHIVKSLHQAPELSNLFEEVEHEPELHDNNEAGEFKIASDKGAMGSIRGALGLGLARHPIQSISKPSYPEGGEGSTGHARNALTRGRVTRLSMNDVADRFLQDRTDSIAYIIRNISEQCAAAVEGLQLAQRAEGDGESIGKARNNELEPSEPGLDPSFMSETGDDESNLTERNSIPPTPDLVHNRISTAMSITTDATVLDRDSTQPHLPTKIIGQDDESSQVHVGEAENQQEDETVTKRLIEGPYRGPNVATLGST